MNRSYDQGLGLLKKYTMMYFVCTGFFVLFRVVAGQMKSRCFQRLQEVPSRFELENKGFADLRLTTWLWHRKKMER